MHPELEFALALAETADALSLPRFGSVELEVETKPDLTPVTEADLAVERALRERIAVERPGDGVLGEELGAAGGGGRWILDPIDGTKNFSRGIPIWATLIAFEEDGELAVAVASAPALRRRWWAVRGEGAHADGAPIHVSAIDRLEQAVVSHTPRASAARLDSAAWHLRGLGDFWQHVLVAEGAVDVAVDPAVAAWDVAAIKLIVEEAGGRVTDLDGAARFDGGSAVSTNGRLHDKALAALR